MIGEERGRSTTVHLEVPSIILEAIRKPKVYAPINLMLNYAVTSKHTAALYEILKDYIKLKTITITIEDFRKLMGIPEKTYKMFAMLEERVIQPAVEKTSEKTDITVAYVVNRV